VLAGIILKKLTVHRVAEFLDLASDIVTDDSLGRFGFVVFIFLFFQTWTCRLSDQRTRHRIVCSAVRSQQVPALWNEDLDQHFLVRGLHVERGGNDRYVDARLRSNIPCNLQHDVSTDREPVNSPYLVLGTLILRRQPLLALGVFVRKHANASVNNSGANFERA
jgi:hypothetical protein